MENLKLKIFRITQCPKCLKNYSWKNHEKSKFTPRIPYLLFCSHSICSFCIENAFKKNQTIIKCQICQVDTVLPYDFEIDSYILGFSKTISDKVGNPNKTVNSTGYFTFEMDKTSQDDKCHRCARNPIIYACPPCAAYFCVVCFYKAHQAPNLRLPMKDHQAIPFGQPPSYLCSIKCNDHNAPLELYCDVEKEYICMKCAYEGHHQEHKQNISLISSKNEELSLDLSQSRNEAKKVLHMLKSSKKDLLLHEPGHDLECDKKVAEIQTHFSQLIGILQQRQLELIKQVKSLYESDKATVVSLKDETCDKIKAVSTLCDAAGDALENKWIPYNFAKLIEELDAVKNFPCALEEVDKNKDVQEEENSEGGDEEENVEMCLNVEVDIDKDESDEEKEGEMIKSDEIQDESEIYVEKGVEVVKIETMVKEESMKNSGYDFLEYLKKNMSKSKFTVAVNTASEQKEEISKENKEEQKQSMDKAEEPKNEEEKESIEDHQVKNVKEVSNELQRDKEKIIASVNKRDRTIEENGFADPILFDLGFDGEILKNIGEVKGKLKKKFKLVPLCEVPEDEITRRIDLYQNESLAASSNSLVSNEATDCGLKIAEKPGLWKTDRVKVSNTTHPGDFSVVRMTKIKELEDMGNLLMTWMNEGRGILIEFPKVGDLVLALYSDDKKWYRAKVTKVNKSPKKVNQIEINENRLILDNEDFFECEVFYLDYGNKETVPVSNLREMDPQFLNVEFLAIPCALEGIVPLSQEGWSADAIALFKEATNGIDFVFHKFEECGGVNFIDLRRQLDGRPFSMREWLVNNGVACFETCKSASFIASRRIHPSFDYARVNLPLKETVKNISICYVNDPHSFFVQRLDQKAELCALLDVMKDEYHKQQPQNLLYPTPGMPGFIEDMNKTCYRIRVIRCLPNHLVKVLTVDYGKIMTFPQHLLRIIDPEFLQLPPQAIECKLDDIEPLSPLATWSTKATAYLEQLQISRQQLNMFITNVVENKFSVVLYKPGVGQDINVNALLVEKKLARNVGENSTVVKILRGDFPPSYYTNQARERNLFRQNVLLASIERYCTTDDDQVAQNSSVNVEQKDKIITESNSGGGSGKIEMLDAQVKISHCESPELIYFQNLDKLNEFNDLHKKLMSIFKQTPKVEDAKWSKGDMCAFCRQIEWRRAEITEVFEDKAAVLFVDYGIKETVSLNNLRSINKELMSIPPFAKRCHLHEATPAGDTGTWTRYACQKLDEFFKEHNSFRLVQKGPEVNGSIPVDLIYEDICFSGALAPCVRTNKSVISVLQDQGLAIKYRKISKTNETAVCDKYSKENVLIRDDDYDADESDKLSSHVNELEDNASENDILFPNDYQSSKNVGSVGDNSSTSEDQELGKLFYNLETDSGSNSHPSSIYCPVTFPENCSLTETIPKNSLPEVPRIKVNLKDFEPQSEEVPKEWKQCSLPKSHEFDASITHVDDDGIFYVVESTKMDKLKIMSDILTAKDKERDPEDSFWFEGDLCIAQYKHGDWHRGQVMNINSDSSPLLYTVRYVDYGTIEEITCNQMRKKLDYTHFPLQCYKCQLYDIKPATENRKWDNEVIEFVRKHYLDKMLRVILRDKPTHEFPIKVSIVVPDGDLSKIISRFPTVELIRDQKPAEFDLNYSFEDQVMDNPFQSCPVPNVGDLVQITLKSYKKPLQYYVQRIYINKPETDFDMTTNCQLLKLKTINCELVENYKNFELIDYPNIGDAVCCMHWENTPHRGLIISGEINLDGEYLYTVLFVDYGEEVELRRDKIRRLPEKFLDLPAQAFCCKLFQVSLPIGKNRSTSEKVLNDLVNCKTYEYFAEIKEICDPVKVNILRSSPGSGVASPGNLQLAYQKLIDENLIALIRERRNSRM